MMNHRIPKMILFAATLLLAAAVAAQADESRVAVSERQRAFLQSHCAKCHDATTQEGKFRVDDLPLHLADLPTAER